jgi:ppGpp synthetase/RelA/SpoT-type nucleotidyltranferase
MANQKLKYSLGFVDKAGNVLARGSKDLAQDDAWEILENWRAAHHVPLHYLAINLSRHARKIDKNVLLARRLKRAPAIFAKLKREPAMLLRRMQDIAGCRAILPNLEKTLLLSESFQKSTQNHELVRVKNYIAKPKPSGYRGIHLIYKFNSADQRNMEWNGRSVEIQIRSMNQHIWATAVEIVGMMTKQALKASKGEQNWLDFFKSVSEGFAYLDRKEKVPDAICRDITNRAKKLQVQKKLTAYTYAVEKAQKASADYYLLILEGMQLSIQGFNDGESAEQAYVLAERKLVGVGNADVVLVGAESFHQLKRAYPNYFGDSERFVKTLDSMMILRKSWWQLGS